MQQQTSNGGISSGLQQNGSTADSGGPHANGNMIPESDNDINSVNGETNQNLGPPKIMDKTNQDIVRLIGQHLKTVGLKYVTFNLVSVYSQIVVIKNDFKRSFYICYD